MEIYNETVRDLLADPDSATNKTGLHIVVQKRRRSPRSGARGSSPRAGTPGVVVIEDLTIENVNSIEEMRDAMEGLLSAKIEESIVGTAEIRETFKISKIGTIAGCFVTEGKIFRSSKVRVLREGIVVYTGLLGSLKRFKDDVKEVAKGYECGLNIDKFNDIKVGDVVEAYEDVEVKQTLDDA